MCFRGYLLCVFLLISTYLWSQNQQEKNQNDTKYFEDQFYAALTYNILSNRPVGVSQNSLSYGIQFGFIKDLPLNAKRNFALGIGIGYATASYYNNLKASKRLNEIEYTIIDGATAFNVNKLETHTVELPLELRWRTSSPSEYKFWRVYAGFKLGYAFASTSKFSDADGSVKFNNDDLNKLSYGLTLSMGYNTWNFHAYYGLNKLLNEASVIESTEMIDMQALKIGLIFYIL